jgi:copper chaperone CopZ
MTRICRSAVSAVVLAVLLLSVQPVRAEYLHIQTKVYGLDCELCARGVAASIHRLAGVKSVEVSLNKGMLEIELLPGNSFKMSDLRKRIRDNGFRAMDATVTAVGRFSGSRFEVLGSGESYELRSPDPGTGSPVELTFDVH